MSNDEELYSVLIRFRIEVMASRTADAHFIFDDKENALQFFDLVVTRGFWIPVKLMGRPFFVPSSQLVNVQIGTPKSDTTTRDEINEPYTKHVDLWTNLQ